MNAGFELSGEKVMEEVFEKQHPKNRQFVVTFYAAKESDDLNIQHQYLF